MHGIIPFEIPPHIESLLSDLLTYRLNIILKSRQVYVTWTIQGFSLWRALFHVGANIITLSKGEEEATEELDYARFIHKNLPAFLRISKGKDQSSLIDFPVMDSKMRALPSTEAAGVGFGGATQINLDEFEYHPYAEKNYSELKPMIDAGGQLNIYSNTDKLRLNTKFKELYVKAMTGDSGFHKIFIPYNVLPERTQEWYDNLHKDYADWEVECKYPRTEAEALESLKTRRFFDDTAIGEMYADIKKPAECELAKKHASVKIYRLPIVGRRYCIFTDPSTGKEDPHAIIVIEHGTCEEVAESHGKTTADQCAVIHDDLVRFYNNAFNSYELNAQAGGIFSEKIEQLGTPNRCDFLKNDGKLQPGKKGWYTSTRGQGVRDRFVWGLEEAVRQRQITIHSKECLDEFKPFMIPEGEEPQAPKGGHDDYVDAWGRVLFLRKYLPAEAGEVRSYAARRS